MPLSQNYNAFLGAGVLGVLCAATFYVIEHYRQERRRLGLAKDVARLDTELSLLKRELNKLQSLHKAKLTQKRQKKKNEQKTQSTITSTVSDDYNSAIEMDSSDMEYYDLSDEDMNTQERGSFSSTYLTSIDQKLNNSDESVESCLAKLTDLICDHPDDPNVLWRIGRCHYMLREQSDDRVKILDRIGKGIEACQSALKYPPELAETHKWLAILIGSRAEYQSIREKILDGVSFKEHLDRALELDADDPSLHHMLGRFIYEYAKLNWYEKKTAAFIGGMPVASYEIALGHFMRAEELSKRPYKENKLYVAKCKLALAKHDCAIEWLENAAAVACQDENDHKIEAEIQELIKKHSKNV